MKRAAAEVLREYGPFPGVGRVNGVTFDGRQVWFASGDKLNAVDPESGRVTTYGYVRLPDEQQFSVYNFEMADVEKAGKHFELCEAECKGLLEKYAGLGKKDDAPVSSHDGGTKAGHPDKARFPLLAIEIAVDTSDYRLR